MLFIGRLLLLWRMSVFTPGPNYYKNIVSQEFWWAQGEGYCSSDGSNRAQNTATKLSELLFFLVCLMYSSGLLWVLNIPKWLMLTLGHIAILLIIFGTSKKSTKYGPRPLYLLQKHFEKYRNSMDSIYKHISFVNMDIRNFENF